jgi:hypothetical protein
MASQVLSGASNPSYTNNTGQNVRIVINYMASPTTVSWGGVSASTTGASAIGRNIAGISTVGSANNAIGSTAFALPTELMLSTSQTFTATCGAYNIVVIPEAG